LTEWASFLEVGLLFDIFGGEILAGSEIYVDRGGSKPAGGDGDVIGSGGVKSELSKEQDILRTLQR